MGEQEKKTQSVTHTLADVVKTARPDEVDQAIETLRRHWQNPLKEEIEEQAKILQRKSEDLEEVGAANVRLQEGIEAVRKENGDLRSKLHAAEKVRDALELDKEAATKAAEDLAAKLTDSDAARIALNDQLEQARAQWDQAKVEMEQLAKEKVAAEAERDRFAKDVMDTAEKVNMQETAIEELQQDVEQTRARLTAANRTAAEAVQDRISRQNELNALRDTIDAVEASVNKYREKQPLLRTGQTEEPVEVEGSRPGTRTAPFEIVEDEQPSIAGPAEVVSESLNPASAMPTQEIPAATVDGKAMTADWPELKKRLDAEVARYAAIPKRPGGPSKLTSVIVPLLKRYEGGERTRALAEAIDDNCR